MQGLIPALSFNMGENSHPEKESDVFKTIQQIPGRPGVGAQVS